MPRPAPRLRELYLEPGPWCGPRSCPDKEEAAAKFKDYFDWSEPLAKIPSHRLLAMRRGEEEGFLMMRITPPEEEALALARTALCHRPAGPPPSRCAWRCRTATSACSARPSKWRCAWSPRRRPTWKPSGCSAENLRELLLAPPLGARTCWPSTRASAPAAKSSASTARASCCTTMSFTRRSVR